MRITQKLLNESALDGMQANLKRLSGLQKQAVTTKRVNRPSDDPYAVEQGLNFRTQLQASETARQNIDRSKDWLYATDVALNDTVTLLTRTKALALQGANGTLGPDERQSVAIELEGILEQTIAISNTRHGEHYLFSGFKVDQRAYNSTRDPVTGNITAVTANGDISGQITREVEPGIDMVVNVPGNSVFGDIFSTLIDLRDALLANPFVPANVSGTLDQIDSHIDKTLDTQAAIGTKVRRLNSTASRMEAAEVGIKELLSKGEDANMPEVVSQLNQQQFVYQTALAVNAQVLRTSLLDFLR